MRAADLRHAVEPAGTVETCDQKPAERSNPALAPAVESVDDAFAPASLVMRKFVDDAAVVRAAVRRGAVEIAFSVHRKGAAGPVAVVAPGKAVQHALARSVELPRDAAAVAGANRTRSSRDRRAEKIGVPVERDAAVRVLSVAVTRKVVENRLLPRRARSRRQFKDRSAVIVTSTGNGRAVKTSVAAAGEIRRRIGTVGTASEAVHHLFRGGCANGSCVAACQRRLHRRLRSAAAG